ncbi:ATP-dependent RNA helicase [Strigomonas culicis]|uniref:ATP-dependent RNA helicase n=1 Tax=Strigomonas culicis TaxID=28005 RepID=S9V2C7_9TRYP|nr:ATP-dependent RNA helicase [Strigomonas culicis]|eukprot:EPY37257.1 ATP-dependent RNA helicase [Strigomonas culicis]
MLSYLAQRNVKLREIAIKPNLFHVSSQDIFVALVVQGLKYEAQKAFIAYLRSVYFASNKHVFNMAAIDVEAFAKSLGLLVVPDTSELQNMQRGAKNMPWAIANYVEQNKHKKQVASDDDEEAEGGAAKGSMTRKEKHLKASDMFRLLEQKQKFAAKDGSLFGGTAASAAVHDDEEDDFLVKKTPSAAAQKDMEKDRQLTVDERMAGLSKNKIKRFIETPDLRVRDLNLSRHRVFRDDSDDEVVEVTADEEEEASQEKKKTAKTGKDGNADDDNAAEERERAALLRQAVLEGKKQQRLQQAASADSEDDEGTSDESETEFTEKLRSRIHGVKGEDAVRSKKMRQLRKLQKAGKVSRKAPLEELQGGGHAEAELRDEDEAPEAQSAKPRHADFAPSSDDDDISLSDVASDSSVGQLIRTAQEQYKKKNKGAGGSDEARDDDKYYYFGEEGKATNDADYDNDDDDDDDDLNQNLDTVDQFDDEEEEDVTAIAFERKKKSSAAPAKRYRNIDSDSDDEAQEDVKVAAPVSKKKKK